jgi:predicted alpha/beta-hydrolase family hydrolase
MGIYPEQERLVEFMTGGTVDTARVPTAAMVALSRDGDRATRPEARSPRGRRDGRKRYRRAQRMYGKTYLVTQYQLCAGIAVMIGSGIMMAAILVYWYALVVERASRFS